MQCVCISTVEAGRDSLFLSSVFKPLYLTIVQCHGLVDRAFTQGPLLQTGLADP